ncbi:hypothetical protein E2493_11290 [Sphingomonas parva]|uniref:Uncharacterized protein n=1 Tax=Sphingomonas parva TaxID=2555898 RepID=A0A4Y8ZTT4_9SPHN|nr:hypothetical protein [Sphingomonas parva]TFI58159.1 hypothetical protein E2493_11290 [Sphingomonas parva]
MARGLLSGRLSLLLLLGACAAVTQPPKDAPVAGPSAGEVSDAMGAAMPRTLEPGASYQCEIPRYLECAPVGDAGRFRCTYQGNGGQHREVVLKRATREQHERLPIAWRWIRGRKNCGILY